MAMSELEILTYPDDQLRQKCLPVEAVNDEVRALLNSMLETMYASAGIGLAGPQVGALLRVIVIDVSPDQEEGEPKQIFKLINPEILEGDGQTETEEGCLSIPGIRETVKRKAHVVVRALDEEGKETVIDAQGILAVCLQHEIDHLDGVLFIDRLSRLKRGLLRSKLRKIAQGE